MHTVYLGLGTNLGDRRHNIAEAVRLIGERVGTVRRLSSLFETEPPNAAVDISNVDMGW